MTSRRIVFFNFNFNFNFNCFYLSLKDIIDNSTPTNFTDKHQHRGFSGHFPKPKKEFFSISVSTLTVVKSSSRLHSDL